MHGLKRRPGGRSARVREAVIAATCDVLADVGYDDLTFEAVAAQAGVHKTTVYRRWATKADLVLDALLARSENVIELPDTGRLDRDLFRFLRSVAANVTSPLGHALVVATLRMSAEVDTARSVRHRFWDERFDKARGRLDEAVRDGELASDVDTALLVESLVSPIFFRALVRGAPINDRFLRSLIALHIGT